MWGSSSWLSPVLLPLSEILLTYIVPVYNTEAYVLRCLQSIADQGLDTAECEVIVVDDGSTDGSRAVVEAFAADHPSIRLFCQPNQGVSVARNLALDNARGRYIQFVDSDDYLLPGKMQVLLQRALDERLDVLLFNYSNIDSDGNSLPQAQGNVFPSTLVSTGPEFLDTHPMTPYVWRFLIRRGFFEQGNDYLGPERGWRRGWRFDTSLIVCEDGALIARFMLDAGRMAYDDTVVYCYVDRGDSAMHSIDLNHIARRLHSQVDSAASIDGTISRYESQSGRRAPASVAGIRNVYLYFSMTKALTCGLVDDVLQHIRQVGLFPFPCIGPEANYGGVRWKVIHWLMMRPAIWKALSKIYRLIRK